MKATRYIFTIISGAILMTSCLSSTIWDGQGVININPVLGTDVRSAGNSKTDVETTTDNTLTISHFNPTESKYPLLTQQRDRDKA